MRWRGRRQSTNVEDRRGKALRRGGVAVGGGGVLLLALLAMLLGEDPSVVLDATAPGGGRSQQAGGTGAPLDDEASQFAKTVLADTEDAWARVFASHGLRYQPPVLVIFRDQVSSTCGFQSAATGPFYCPGDRKLYLDLSFFDDLSRRFGAPGDFAQAYVIAHEVGHHVQQLLGISDRVRRREARVSRTDRNALSVLHELQADCLAGVWGHHAARQRDFLERGDLEEGLAAAGAIGDDRLQRQAGARVRPESWTHGSSRQRQEWLVRGLETGDIERCDTFAEAGVRF